MSRMIEQSVTRRSDDGETWTMLGGEVRAAENDQLEELFQS